MPDWRQLLPQSLILDPTLMSSIADERRATEAMQYAYSVGTSSSYDDLAFRIYAASVRRGEVPLQTIPSMKLARERENATRQPSTQVEAMEQEALLCHRPIEAPLDGRFSYTIDRKLIHLRRRKP